MTLVFPSSLIIHRSFSLSVFHSATILRHDSCSEGLLQTHYVANKGLPVPPGCWSYRYAPCWSRPVFPSPRQRVEHHVITGCWAHQGHTGWGGGTTKLGFGTPHRDRAAAPHSFISSPSNRRPVQQLSFPALKSPPDK